MDGPTRKTAVKLFHALLLHGAGNDDRTQDEFWRLVRDLDARDAENDRGISRNTGIAAVRGLAERRLVARRPLRLGLGLGTVIGVSVGTRSVRAGLFDANGDLVEVEPDEPGAEPTFHVVQMKPLDDQLKLRPDELLDRIVGAIKQVALGALSDRALQAGGPLPVLGVAVAWPTPLNRWTKAPTGLALEDPAWRTVTRSGGDVLGLDRLVGERLHADPQWSSALNDANAVALSVAFNRSRAVRPDSKHSGGVVLALQLGGGVGAGTVVLGSSEERLVRSPFLSARLLEGSGGYAGELGHWQVPTEDLREILGADRAATEMRNTPTCACGRRRCLELFVGGLAIERRLRDMGFDVDRLNRWRDEHSLELIDVAGGFDGDAHELLVDVLHNAGRLLGRSLAAPILMLNPESVTIAGALASDALREGLEAEKDRWGHAHQEGPSMKVLTGVEGRFAAARGAALAVFRERVHRRLDLGQELEGEPTLLSREMVDSWESDAALTHAGAI